MLLAAADPRGRRDAVWRAAAAARDRHRRARARGGRRAAGDRRAGPVPPSAGALGGLPGRVAGRRRRVHEALAEVERPASSTPIAAPGTARWRRPDPTRTSPPSSSARRGARRRAAASRPRRRFLERAAALTADPARRARRALAAAQAKHQAGAPEAALALLASAQAGPLDELQRAQADLLRAQIAFTSEPRQRRAAAPARRRQAARAARRDARARDLPGGADGGAVRRAASPAAPRRRSAEAARAAPPAPAPRAPDLLLDGLASMITEGHAAGAPLLKRALDAFRDDDIAANGGFRWLWLAEEAAIELWDHDTWRELAARELQLVREAGRADRAAARAQREHRRADLRRRAGRGRVADRRGDDRHRGDREPSSRPTARWSSRRWRGREAELDGADRGDARRRWCRAARASA